MARILVFGDSIAWGMCDTEKGGWVERLKVFLYKEFLADESYDYSVYNLGIAGDNAEDLTVRFDFETRQRFFDNCELIFIFKVGTVDAEWLEGQKAMRTQPEAFRKNLLALIGLSRKFSSKIMFVGLTPVDESGTMPWWKDICYFNESLRKYDSIIQEVCREEKIPFVDTFSRFEKEDCKRLLSDFLHPNAKGHEMIFEEVRKELIKNKFI